LQIAMSNKTVYITRRARFNSAHKLWNESWSNEKNHEVFGKCANENWHGHNYVLHVTVKGTPSPDTGFCIDLKDLTDIIRRRVEDPLDHRNINLDVEWMKGKMASTENLIIEIWEQLFDEISERGCTLHQLRLFETENNYADYYGGE
jgi:6-pyruvoyltetrahydropterin/6-carboxytetrahydropterin synthase